ncbi:hypothetical protein ACFLXN_02480 [Chloroflexota bacterium]
MYPDMSGIIDSTAAARINGYIGGYGTLDDLEVQIDSLGLSEGAAAALLDRGSRVLAE